ncbi:hypothetical protein C7271_14955 [filamentous cyanobacterium CCP5]|nr:hypothetical protein C7271_14955 [filamentous cyanobacterium CCP5]
MTGIGKNAIFNFLKTIPTVGLLALVMGGCFRAIATPEAVEHVEQVFAANRAVLVELATTSLQEMQQSGQDQLKLPDTDFYDFAWAAESYNRQALIVDFVIEEYYLPLVYISTDNPDDAHDTCTNGGRPVKQLEPHWYICKRDWN